MTILIVVFILSVFFAILNFFPSTRRLCDLGYFFVFSACVLIITFRQNTYDVLDYQKMFLSADWSLGFGSEESHGEPLFQLLILVSRTLGFNFRFFLGLVGFLSLGLTFTFYRAYSKYYFLSAVIFIAHSYLLRDMIQIRAGLAASIMLWSIGFIESRKSFKFFLITFAASCVHFTALIYILPYVLYPYLKTRERAVWVLILTSPLLGILLNESLFLYLLDLTNLRVLYLYLADETYNYSLGILNPVALKASFICFCYWLAKTWTSGGERLRTNFIMYMLGLIWLNAFSFFAIFGARIANMLFNTEHLIIPNLLFNVKNQLLRLILYVLTLGVFAVIFYLNIRTDKLRDLSLGFSL